MENLKEILRDENCLGMITKHPNNKGYAYQPTNDMGFWFDTICDEDVEIYHDNVKTIKLGVSKYVIMVEDPIEEDLLEYGTLDELLKGEELIK